MPNIASHKPGAFCWIELGTTDQPAAKNFYSELFGWTANDFPMGPNDFYTMFQLDGQNVAAAYTIREDMRQKGVPPHWLLYVTVEDADATAAQAKALGATVRAEPFDVYDFGRMAPIADPAGAMFAIWQAKNHTGIGIAGVPGTLCWADLSTPDQHAAARFYSDLFKWELVYGEIDKEYLHIKNGGDYIGGVPSASQRDPSGPPAWTAYFATSDCRASAEKAKQLGAKLLMEPTTIEMVGDMAVVADPQGAVFALFTPAPRG